MFDNTTMVRANDDISLRRASAKPIAPAIPAQLVALDLDGTVLSPTGHVTPRTRAAIRRLIDGGVHVVIATGRSWWESRAVIAEAALEGPGVFAGGAIVNEMVDGRSLAHSLMARDTAQSVCRIVRDAGLAAMVLQDRDHADVEWLIAAELDMPNSMPQWLEHHGSSYRRAADLADASHDGTVRISTIAGRDQHAELARVLIAALGERIYLHEIIVPVSGVSVMEIFDAGVNKWTGIERVARLHNVDTSAVVAVGDDMNDLHMLRHAALGVAMGNARDEVKAVADRVIGTNAEDGLAAFLEALIEIGIETNDASPTTFGGRQAW